MYLTLAILMGGGLILFGVGTGERRRPAERLQWRRGRAQSQTVSAAEKSAEKAVKTNPTSAAAWAQLVQLAGQVPDRAPTTTPDADVHGRLARRSWPGRAGLAALPPAHQGKDPKQIAVLAGRVYASEGNYAGEASAWEVESASDPGEVKGYECLAPSAYAAGQTRKGDLALGKALTLVPKVQRKTLNEPASGEDQCQARHAVLRRAAQTTRRRRHRRQIPLAAPPRAPRLRSPLKGR